MNFKHLISLFFFLLLGFNSYAQKSTVILNEGFSTDLGSMTAYNEAGNEAWGLESSYGQPAPSAKMSGFNVENYANKDWLISPKIDLSGYAFAEFSFDEAINYDTDVANHFKVLISSNYSGNGNPNDADWSELNLSNRSAGNSWTFVSTGTQSLNSWAGNSNIHIAFKYISTDAVAGTWEIDNILVNASVQSHQIEYLDVVTYNIEWLGKPDMAGLSLTRNAQITKAAEDILAADAEIFALQEMVIDTENGNALADLITKLNELDDTETWAGDYNQYFSFWWNPDFTQYPAQRQAFVYRTSALSNVNFETLLTSEIPQYDTRFGSGRLPFMLEADVTLNGKTEHIHWVNVHLKCCSGYSDRRKASMETLVNELNTNFINDNVIVLGDMNVADAGGAYGEISTWGFYDDNNGDQIDDFIHAAGSVQDISYADIDHILISDELTEEYNACPVELQNKILSTTVSDHSPVKTSLLFENVTTGLHTTNNTEPNFRVYTVPASKEVINIISLNSESVTTLEIYSITGVCKKSTNLFQKHSTINIENLVPGIYFLVLKNSGITETKKIIVK